MRIGHGRTVWSVLGRVDVYKRQEYKYEQMEIEGLCLSDVLETLTPSLSLIHIFPPTAVLSHDRYGNIPSCTRLVIRPPHAIV